MPNVRLPSGGMELHNFNKDSDHPNPYAPPHALDQLFGNNYPASYPIYHHPWKDDEEMKKRGGSRMMYHNPMLNEMKEKDLSHQFMSMTWRGFWFGCALSYVDVMYVTQTVSTRTALARFLYITPPVAVIPPSYILAYQILTIKDDWKKHKNGVDKMWPYVAAAFAPAAIWATFRRHFIAGVAPFTIFAGYGVVNKLNEDTGGMFMGGNYRGLMLPYGAFGEKNRGDFGLLNISSDPGNKDRKSGWFEHLDPGPKYQQFYEK